MHIKTNHSQGGHKISRRLLANILLLNLEKMNIPIGNLAKAATVSKSSINNLKAGKLLSLTTFGQLFSSPLIASVLSPQHTCEIMSMIISESLPPAHPRPEFRMIDMPEEELQATLPHLSAYLKDIRVKRLKLSKNKIDTHLDCSYYRQLIKIEDDCHGVGIGPICYLFYRYTQELPDATDRDWDIFATLVLRKLFSRMTACKLEFIGWRAL